MKIEKKAKMQNDCFDGFVRLSQLQLNMKAFTTVITENNIIMMYHQFVNILFLLFTCIDK